DDGGRLFHPYGPRDRFGRATLATAAILLDKPEWLHDPDDLHEQAVWWLGAHALKATRGAGKWRSRLFAASGVAVMISGDTQVIIDAGAFGPASAGHSHSDTLSLIVRTL